ncbi:MAG: peptidylprolyl isomerase [Proteobacteria bacterium]|nr:peptidylprolyl isomerase [Pseudomonadota bacterium]MBU1417723.1 peptidylprolyl isomerase [Pseudomonadota bacterium]MBU1454937.1 peptidylprolyl isomerase [Pseudomonadota bacterium]
MLPEKKQKRIDPTLSFHLMKFAILDYQKSSSELTENEYRRTYQLACEEMLLHQLILSSEEACCVVVPDPVLQRALLTIISEYPDEMDFRTSLQENGLRFTEYLTALCNDLRVEAVLTQVASTVQSVDPFEILHYFRSHQESFMHPEQRSADHILIFSDPSSETLTNQAMEQATAIRRSLCRNPEVFSSVAKRYSRCSSGTNGGDLGTIKAGELCEELDRVLFTLNAGEISPVIESSAGFHLLYCRKIHHAKRMSFSEASSRIFSILLKKKQLAACRAWLQALVQPI